MKTWAIGVDLGGTKIEVAIVSSDGAVSDRVRTPTQSDKGPDKIIESITGSIEQLLQQNPGIDPVAIGIGVAGQIEKSTGVITYAPNLDWHNVNLRQQLADKLRKPVAICNDVKAAAWGEWLHGAGKDCDNLVCIFIGTGIGGAVIANGKMLDGCSNTAGEVGHIILQLGGPQCHCGNKGCFEALAGGWAMERDARQAVQNDKEGGAMMLSIAGGNINDITGKTVAMALQKGDAMATRLVDNVAEALIAGITSVVNMLGPCRVILGGGVIEGMPQLVGRVAKGVKEHALKAATAAVEILPAKLHNDSGVIGAAAYAMRMLKE